MANVRIDKLKLLVLPSLLLVQAVQAQKVTKLTIGNGKSKTVSGQLHGGAYADFRLTIGAGQSISVSMRSDSSSLYFNVMPPGSSGAALYNGSLNGNRMALRQLPIEGDYIIRVYQMGAAKSENRTSKFSVTVSLKGSSLKPISRKSDAKIPGTPFHAKAIVPCKIDLDSKRSTCDALVIRREKGAATVELRAGSLKRRVLFKKEGLPIAHDSADAFTYTRQGDETIIRFGDGPNEEFTIPDALITGG